MKKAGQSRRKKVKLYFISVQNFVRIPKFWCTKTIYWRTRVRCVRDFSHPTSHHRKNQPVSTPEHSNCFSGTSISD